MKPSKSPDALRPHPSKTQEDNRIFTLAIALFSSFIFILVALLYYVRRSDSAWVARVPYSTALTRVDRADDVTRLPPGWSPSLPPGVFDAAVFQHMFQTQIRCTVLNQSPRCNCLLRHYHDMVVSRASASSTPAQLHGWYASFATAAGTKACFQEHGAFQVHVFTGDESTAFDGVLFWWMMASLLHLFLNAEYCNRKRTAFLLGLLALVVFVVGVLVFWYAKTHRVLWLCAIVFVPLLTPVVLGTVSIATNFSRPIRHHKWWMWNDVVGEDGLISVMVCIGLFCSQRALLIFSKQNEVADSWFALWLCAFVGLCSGTVRFLRNSILDVHNRFHTLERLSDTTTPKAYALETTLQSVAFAAQWTWFVLIGLAMVLLLLFPSAAGDPFPMCVIAARVSMGFFFVMFVLQIPTRHQKMPFSQPQQQIFFFILESAARLALILPLFFYLLA